MKYLLCRPLWAILAFNYLKILYSYIKCYYINN